MTKSCQKKKKIESESNQASIPYCQLTRNTGTEIHVKTWIQTARHRLLETLQDKHFGFLHK